MPDVSRVSPSVRKQCVLKHSHSPCLQAGPSHLWATQSFGKDAAVTGLAVGKGHGALANLGCGALANLVPLYWTILGFF